jgi:hypothetical protein
VVLPGVLAIQAAQAIVQRRAGRGFRAFAHAAAAWTLAELGEEVLQQTVRKSYAHRLLYEARPWFSRRQKRWGRERETKNRRAESGERGAKEEEIALRSPLPAPRSTD